MSMNDTLWFSNYSRLTKDLKVEHWLYRLMRELVLLWSIQFFLHHLCSCVRVLQFVDIHFLQCLLFSQLSENIILKTWKSSTSLKKYSFIFKITRFGISSISYQIIIVRLNCLRISTFRHQIWQIKTFEMPPFLTSVAPAPFVGSSWTRPLTWSGHHCSASQLSSCQSSDSLPFSPGPKYALYTKSIKHIHVGGDMYAAF